VKVCFNSDYSIGTNFLPFFLYFAVKKDVVEDAIPDPKHKKRKQKSSTRRFKFSACTQSWW